MRALNIKFIDHLRQAAAEYGAVADLLDVVASGLLLGEGNNEVVADEDERAILLDAQVAAAFARYDREGPEGIEVKGGDDHA